MTAAAVAVCRTSPASSRQTATTLFSSYFSHVFIKQTKYTLQRNGVERISQIEEYNISLKGVYLYIYYYYYYCECHV